MTGDHAPVGDRIANGHTQSPAVRPGRAALAGAGLAAGAGAVAYLRAVDPRGGSALLPRCPLHWATGLSCPGCGGLRMTHDVLQGDLAAAFADNAVLLLLAPLLLVLLGSWAVRWLRGRGSSLDRRVALPLLAVALGWFAVRNLAGW